MPGACGHQGCLDQPGISSSGGPAAVRTPPEQDGEDCVNILIKLSLNADEGEIFISFTDKTDFFFPLSFLFLEGGGG